MIYIFLAVLSDAFNLILTKTVFNRLPKISLRSFIWLGFATIVLVNLAVAPFFASFNFSLLTWRILGLVLLLGGVATLNNFLFYYSLKFEKIGKIEPFLLFTPLITTLVAGLVFPDERYWPLFIATGLAGLVLAWAHLDKGTKIRLNLPILALFGYLTLYALEAILAKQLLAVFSPQAVYLVRTAVVLLLVLLFIKPKTSELHLEQMPYFIAVAVLAVWQSTLLYTAYKMQGVAETIFAFTLAPVFIYGFSILFLKEKVFWKDLMASLIVVTLVTAVFVMKAHGVFVH